MSSFAGGDGGGAAEILDNSAFTAGSSSIGIVGSVFDDVLPSSVPEGFAGALRMSANRNGYMTIRDAAGNERGADVTTANALKIDGSAVTQPISVASLPLPLGAATSANQTTMISSLSSIDGGTPAALGQTTGAASMPVVLASDINLPPPGTGATNLGKAEDTVHSSGDTGVMMLSVRQDTPTALAGADGKYAPLQVGANGNLHVNLGTKIRGEDETNDVMKVEQQMTYTNIVSATTTTVKSGAGFFHALVINKLVGSDIITIYDNTAGSGTKIATLTFPATLLNDPGRTVFYNVKFSTGLTIVTSTAADLTIASRS